MQNSQALTSREFQNCRGAMRLLYGEGTGSVIVEEQSAPYQGVPRMWTLLSPADPYSFESHSATTGVCLVFIRNDIVPQESSVTMEFNFEAARVPVALPPAFVLDKVRTVFGLNISETAEVFGITRQTAYQWMKFTDMEQVRAHENRDRIKQLYGVTQSWQTHSPLKGRWLHALLPSGNTLFDLLKAEQIDLNALQIAYQTLTASTKERRREEGERATRAVTALAGAFAGLGAGRKTRKGAS